MTFFVYILYSSQRDRYYIGHTRNVETRLQQHCVRKNLGADDWKVLHTEAFTSRSEAMKREAFIKAKKSRTFIESLLGNPG